MPYPIRITAFSALLWAVITLVLGVVLKAKALVHASAAITTLAILVIVIECFRYGF
jgi:hypothetical protein